MHDDIGGADVVHNRANQDDPSLSEANHSLRTEKMFGGIGIGLHLNRALDNALTQHGSVWDEIGARARLQADDWDQ